MAYLAARFAVRMTPVPTFGPSAEIVYRFGCLAVGASLHLHGGFLSNRRTKFTITSITWSSTKCCLDGRSFEAGLVQVDGGNKVKGPLSRAFKVFVATLGSNQAPGEPQIAK